MLVSDLTAVGNEKIHVSLATYLVLGKRCQVCGVRLENSTGFRPALARHAYYGL
jgi:hypothetical protein